MTQLEILQAESIERRRLIGELKRLKKQKKKFEAKLFIEEVPEPEYVKPITVKKEIPKPDKKIVLKRIMKYVEPPVQEPKVDVEKIREFVNSKKPQVNKVYESAFTYKEDAHRPQRHPAKYSNRKAIDDYI